MKIFGFILACLISISVVAQEEQEPAAPGAGASMSEQLAYQSLLNSLREAKIKADKTSIRKFMKTCEKGTKDENGVPHTIPLTSQLNTRASCEDIDDLVEEFEITNKDGEKCAEAYGDYTKDSKSDKDDGISELVSAKEELANARASAEESMTEARERAETASVTYQRKAKELQDALKELKKKTKKEADTMIQEIQSLISQLEKNLTIDRDLSNMEYQNSIMAGYEQCRVKAEAMYHQAAEKIREYNRAENTGQKMPGVASLNKPSDIGTARKKAAKEHALCVSETKRNLDGRRDATMKALGSQEVEINQKLESKKSEYASLTGEEYNDELQSLMTEIDAAAKEMQTEKNSANAAIQTASNKLHQVEQAYTIKITSSEKKAGLKPPGKDEPMDESKSYAHGLCCDGNQLRANVSRTAGTPRSTWCRNGSGSGKKSGKK